MKKNLLLAFMLLAGSSSLHADYELFVTYTKPKSSINVVKKTLVFTGDYKQYQEEVVKFNKGASGAGAATAYATAIGLSTGTLAGLGGGLVMGLMTPVIWDMQADQQFIRVEKLEDSKGNFTLKRTLMVGDRHPTYTVEEANEIMKGGK